LCSKKGGANEVNPLEERKKPPLGKKKSEFPEPKREHCVKTVHNKKKKNYQ